MGEYATICRYVRTDALQPCARADEYQVTLGAFLLVIILSMELHSKLPAPPSRETNGGGGKRPEPGGVREVG
jgi:hypothetical protein